MYVMCTNSTAGQRAAWAELRLCASQGGHWTCIDRFEGAGIEIDSRTVGRGQAVTRYQCPGPIDRSIYRSIAPNRCLLRVEQIF